MKNENRLIGEFMGWNYSKSGNTARMNAKDPRSSPYRLKDIQFDTSWDWLMPVVEKIDSLLYFTEINNSSCKIFQTHPMSCTEINSTFEFGNSKIEAVYKAVVSFIKNYNTIK